MTPRQKHLLVKFGITEDQYLGLLQKQGNCCAVCKRPASHFKTRLAVDHCHGTGEIRGILCTFCNRYLVGRHRRETSAGLLLSAAQYLLRPEYTGWIAPPKIKKRKKKRRVQKVR